MSNGKTYLVTFCVRDCYRINLVASSKKAALEQAQQFYDEDGSEPFGFDYDDGGTCDWNAEQVRT